MKISRESYLKCIRRYLNSFLWRFLPSRLVQRWRGGRRQCQHRKCQQTRQRFPSTRGLRSLLAGALWRQSGGCGEERRRTGGPERCVFRRRQHEDHDTAESPDERSGESRSAGYSLKHFILLSNQQEKKVWVKEKMSIFHLQTELVVIEINLTNAAFPQARFSLL